MKKILFILTLCMVAMTAMAQNPEQKWHAFIETEVGTDIHGNDEFNDYPHDLTIVSGSVAGGYQLNKLLNIGGGVKITGNFHSRESFMNMPVFAQVHLDDFTRECSPYMNIRMGYNFVRSKNNDMFWWDNDANWKERMYTHGFYAQAGWGVRYKHMTAGVNYTFQDLTPTPWKGYSSQWKAYVEEYDIPHINHINYGTISASFGVIF